MKNCAAVALEQLDTPNRSNPDAKNMFLGKKE